RRQLRGRDPRHRRPAQPDRGRESRVTTGLAWRCAFVALTVLFAASDLSPAPAQDWPTRPIRIVVGFGAGGGTDIAARIIGQPLSEILGQPVVVENRVGAGGTTAAQAVATAPKDGYTALMMSNAHVIAPVIYKSIPYDSVQDFAMISLVGTARLIAVVPP